MFLVGRGRRTPPARARRLISHAACAAAAPPTARLSGEPAVLATLLSRLNVSRIGLDRQPAPQPGRHGLAIAAILRNEDRHVAEWAAFHFLSGVRHFVIYDDGSTDATVATLRAVLPADALTVLPWAQRLSDARLGRELHNQVLAYAHAAANFGGAFRWMAFIDVDEFLVPVGQDSLDAALAGLGDCRNVSLPWHMFGLGGNAAPPPGGTVRNFLRRARDPMSDLPGLRAFKSIVDPCHLTAARVHAMETDHSDRTCNDAGQAATFATRERRGFYSRAAIQLNHYYTRSAAELEAKIGRGPNLASKHGRYRRKVLRTAASIAADEVEDMLARDHFARVVAPGLARLGLDPATLRLAPR